MRRWWAELLLAVVLGFSLLRIASLRRTVHATRAQQDSVRTEALRDRAELQAERAKLRSFATLAAQGRVHVPVTLSGWDTDSTPFSLNLAQLRHPVLLFTVDPQCAACARMLPIVDSIQREGCILQVVGVGLRSRISLQDLKRERSLSFPLILGVPGSTWELFPFEIVPAMVLVGPQGRLLGSWTGVLSPAQLAELRSLALNSAARRSC